MISQDQNHGSGHPKIKDEERELIGRWIEDEEKDKAFDLVVLVSFCFGSLRLSIVAL